MKKEIVIYKRIGKKQKIRIAKIRDEKVGIFAWIKLYFKIKKIEN